MRVNNGGTGAGIRRLIRAAEPPPSPDISSRGEVWLGLALVVVLAVTFVVLNWSSSATTGAIVLSLSSFAVLVMRHCWTHCRSAP